MIGDVKGRSCLIVDDMCDTAGTLCKAAALLKEQGATEVHAYISHGVLSGPAIERVSSSELESLVITDSIEPTRITSYNVCYTKLLRTVIGRVVALSDMLGSQAWTSDDEVPEVRGAGHG